MLLLDTNIPEVTSFADMQAWGWLIQFFLLATALLVANVIRCKTPLLRKSLIPTALIAGCLILVLKLFPTCEQFINKQSMEIVTYHALGLGFVALALKNNRIQSRSSATKVIETGAVTASSYVLQGILGLAITIPMFLLWNKESFFYSSGMLLPMGYGQGPGQALNMGNLFMQRSAEQGITFAGADFGLSIAAIGFLVGSIVGVVYMNILRRKGKLKIQGGENYHEQYTLQDYEEENGIPNTESVDKLTVQICLVLFVYFLVFALMWTVEHLEIGNFGATLKPLFWGFNFLWGTLFGVLVKSVLNGFKKAKIIKREYINNYMLNRISGTCFDIMIVAGTAAIDFHNLRGIWLPLIIVCAVGAIGTFVYVLAASKHLYPEYPYEGFFSMFGMLTGTASNGMILLREIDPKFETPASNNLVLQTIPAIVFGFPILLLMGFAPISMHNTWLTIAILGAIYIAFIVFIFRKKWFHKKAK